MGLLVCRWCVGRRAYDAEGLALAALRVPGATVPRGPRQSCQANDERHDERPHHELNEEVKTSEALHCAREHASGAQSRYSQYSHGVLLARLASGLHTRARTEFAKRVLSVLTRRTRSVHVRPSEGVRTSVRARGSGRAGGWKVWGREGLGSSGYHARVRRWACLFV